MKPQVIKRFLHAKGTWIVLGMVFITAAVLGGINLWQSALQAFALRSVDPERPHHSAQKLSVHSTEKVDSQHAGHVHEEDSAEHHEDPPEHDHDQPPSLRLSEQGRKNIGLTLVAAELRDFQRTVAVPAVLIGRSGRTETTISAPMTGIVTRIYPIRGEAVAPGAPLFDLRMTHEDLVDKQSALLRALEELDVINREIARLEKVTASGAIAGKTLLQRQYERQKTEAALRAEKQALLLHGLSDKQIQRIAKERRLLQELTLSAPPFSDHAVHPHDDFYQVTELAVNPGDHIAAGAKLATLADHCELQIEGKAFQQDAEALTRAANQGVEVTALIGENGSGKQEIAGLKILYVENRVDRQSRALKFYVGLPNTQVRNAQTPDGRRFIGWRYKPGQRVEVLLPVERWKNRLVLPAQSLVPEGAETYVYRQTDGRFDRVPVHVEHRDQQWAVIENDGALFPGDVVAGQGAYQIHLALKNKTQGAVDSHAGHHH